ncbi:MAG: hypothetical protein ACREUR_10390 [Nitrosospira sp.]
MTKVLRYGDRIKLQNGYKEWTGGFLAAIVPAADFAYAKYDVMTTETAYCGNGELTWSIESGASKTAGTEIMSGDIILIQNQRTAGRSYLCVSGFFLEYMSYSVLTVTEDQRPLETLTWRITAKSPSPADGKVREGEVIQLLSGDKNFPGGLLDTIEEIVAGGMKYNASACYRERPDVSATWWRVSVV